MATIKVFCVGCGKEIKGFNDFKDRQSLQEFRISGLCQKCQDEVFKEEV